VGPGESVYRLVPLYAYVKLHLTTGLLIAIGLLFGYWRWLQAIAWNPQRQRRTLLPTLMLWFVVLASAIAMIDGGLGRIWKPYELLSQTDYIGAVPLVASAKEFLGDYVRLIPALPMHCQVHPPGGVLFLWWVDRAIWPGPVAAALATVAAAGLAVPAVFGLAGEVLDRRSARLAAGLFLLAPNVMLYTATSMDAVFMVPIVWTFFLLWKARSRESWLLGAAAGVSAAAAAVMTFSAAFLGLWGLSLLAVTLLADRGKLRGTAVALAASGAASLLVLTALYLWSGYNLLENLRAAVAGHHQIMAGGNYATPRQYAHLAVGNLVAFFASTGLPLAVLFVRQSWRDVRDRQNSAPGRVLTLSFLLALVLLAAAPLYTLEVERIWLFMVPLVVISAARMLDRTDRQDDLGADATLTVCLLSIQVVAMEAVLNTTW
jgi:4-amino-4-deoxy-L-arabinose transferase-like glycosyltransferase